MSIEQNITYRREGDLLIWDTREISVRDQEQVTRCLGWFHKYAIDLGQCNPRFNRKQKKAFKRLSAKKKLKRIELESHKLSKCTALTKKNIKTIINKFLAEMWTFKHLSWICVWTIVTLPGLRVYYLSSLILTIFSRTWSNFGNLRFLQTRYTSPSRCVKSSLYKTTWAHQLTL